MTTTPSRPRKASYGRRRRSRGKRRPEVTSPAAAGLAECFHSVTKTGGQFLFGLHELSLKDGPDDTHDGSEVNQYAQRILSTPGKQDGLAWSNSDGSLGGPIAEGTANALLEGYSDRAKPYHGYFFKILKGQGPAAPLGKMDFVVKGAMIGGFALVAAPADYRVTGVKTFIVSYEDVVYQKDLGPDTLKIFKEMELYNPDKSWTPTYDGWPQDDEEASASAAKN